MTEPTYASCYYASEDDRIPRHGYLLTEEEIAEKADLSI
jgi:hypothetical protein